MAAVKVPSVAPSVVDDAKRVMANMDKPTRRTIRAAEYLSVKNALPKTLVGHTIIHENPSQDRLLDLELDRIGYRRTCYLSSHEISRRTFLEQQTRKQRKWKSQDEMRISGMNFPNLRSSAVSGRASVDVMYKSPKYKDGENEQKETLLPYMNLRRERTEFIRRRGVIATTRLPTVIEIDAFKLQRYNTFCGHDFKRLKTRKVQRDKKFTSLMSSLCPLKTEEDMNNDKDGAKSHREEEEDDKTKPWYMTDSESEDEVESTPSAHLRGMSRDSKRKAVVVFPSMTPKSKAKPPPPPPDKYAAPITEELPKMDPRAQTQYQMKKPTNENDGPLRYNDTPRLPKTAPETGSNPPSSRLASLSPRKVVNLSNSLSTEMQEIREASDAPKVYKSILKTPSKNKRKKETLSSKREKIKNDLKSKDLRDLKDKYGPLKGSGKGERKGTAEVEEDNPRDTSEFHSPTLERRFKVKSGRKG